MTKATPSYEDKMNSEDLTKYSDSENEEDGDTR